MHICICTYIYTYIYVYIWARGSSPHPTAVDWSHLSLAPTLETTHGQNDSFFGQLPYKCYLEKVASVGCWLKICPKLDSRVVTRAQTRPRYGTNAELSVNCLTGTRLVKCAPSVSARWFWECVSWASPRSRQFSFLGSPPKPATPPKVDDHSQERRCKVTWKRKFKLPRREAGPPNHLDDKVDSDQKPVTSPKDAVSLGAFLNWELWSSVQFSVWGKLLRRNVKRFRRGLVFKVHRRLHHSTLGSRVLKKKKKKTIP